VWSQASAVWKEEKEKEERSGGAGISSGVGIEERGRGMVDHELWMEDRNG